MPLVLARSLVTVFVFLYGAALITWSGTKDRPERPEHFFVLVAAVFALQAVLTYGAARRVRGWPLLLLAQAIAAISPLMAFPEASWPVNGFFAASMLLAMRGATGWVLFFAASALNSLDTMGGAALGGVATYAVYRLATIVEDMHRTQDGLARATLANERLRIAELLGRRLGEQLEAIVDGLKTGTPAQVADLARATLQDVRAVAEDYRSNPAREDPADTEDLRTARRTDKATWILGLVGYSLASAEELRSPGAIVVLLTINLAAFGILRFPRAALAVQSVAILAGPLFGLPWHSLSGLLAAAILIVLPKPWSWPLAATVLVASMLTAGGLYSVLVVALLAIVGYGPARMVQISAELAEARARLVRMTVLNERLRTSRDVHDLLGFGLSAIALTCDLARRAKEPEPHLAEALRLAEQTRDEARTLTGPRGLSLPDEVAAARSALTAAGVKADLDWPDAIHPPADSVLATLLREAVTNILRHSEARHATVSCVVADGVVAMEVSNDGVVPAPSTRHGHGMTNLAARAAELGGRLVAQSGDGWFHVRAELPVTQIQPA